MDVEVGGMNYRVYTGENIPILQTMQPNSVHCVATDPPYGLRPLPMAVIVEALTAWLSGQPYLTKQKGFMNQTWDTFVPGPECWKECFRVLLPGGNLGSFSSTRTMDILGIAIRLGGFELRDTADHETLRWFYGTGNPAMKNANVSLLIDNHLGVEREKIQVPFKTVRNAAVVNGGHGTDGGDRPWMQRAEETGFHETSDANPVSDEAKAWDGYGTALKPCWEPVLLMRKPLEGSIAENVLKHGTGTLNVKGCLIGDDVVGWCGKNGHANSHSASRYGGMGAGEPRPRVGRWPGNLWLDHHPDCQESCVSGCPRLELDTQGAPDIFPTFKYQGKPSRAERDLGLDGPSRKRQRVNGGHGFADDPKYADTSMLNDHETLKSVEFMRWMLKLICPPGGTVLDPFCGSGTTGIAAVLEGFNFVGIELRPHHAENARKRIQYAVDHPEEFERPRLQKVDSQATLFD